VRRQVGGHLHHVVEVVEGGHIRISLVNTCHYKQFVWDPPCGGYIFVPTQLVFLVGRLHIVDDVETLQGGDRCEDLVILGNVDRLHTVDGIERLHAVDGVDSLCGPVHLSGSRVEHYVGCSDYGWAVLAKDNWGGLVWLYCTQSAGCVDWKEEGRKNRRGFERIRRKLESCW